MKEGEVDEGASQECSHVGTLGAWHRSGEGHCPGHQPPLVFFLVLFGLLLMLLTESARPPASRGVRMMQQASHE